MNYKNTKNAYRGKGSGAKSNTALNTCTTVDGRRYRKKGRITQQIKYMLLSNCPIIQSVSNMDRKTRILPLVLAQAICK